MKIMLGKAAVDTMVLDDEAVLIPHVVAVRLVRTSRRTKAYVVLRVRDPEIEGEAWTPDLERLTVSVRDIPRFYVGGEVSRREHLPWGPTGVRETEVPA